MVMAFPVFFYLSFYCPCFVDFIFIDMIFQGFICRSLLDPLLLNGFYALCVLYVSIVESFAAVCSIRPVFRVRVAFRFAIPYSILFQSICIVPCCSCELLIRKSFIIGTVPVGE
jgi:hypothetical protein